MGKLEREIDRERELLDTWFKKTKIKKIKMTAKAHSIWMSIWDAKYARHTHANKLPMPINSVVHSRERDRYIGSMLFV